MKPRLCVGFGQPLTRVRPVRSMLSEGCMRRDAGCRRMTFLGHKWLNLSASRLSGSEREFRDSVVQARNLLESKMTPAQIAEAQRLASEWQTRTAIRLPENRLIVKSPAGFFPTCCNIRVTFSNCSLVCSELTVRRSLLLCLGTVGDAFGPPDRRR